MILSIVMMVKDEEKNIRRTLNSLRAISNVISTELIVLDTGSEDNTVKIARDFTEHVYFSKWNQNFGDMRNKSISYANGDWILILDADEELVDGTELINFFKSSRYKKYKSGYIMLRNLTSNEDMSKYTPSKVLRLFKKDKDFKYINTIHEQPLYKEPIYEKPLGEFNHYGYLFDDEELKQKKMKRNEELLLKELKKNKRDPYVNYQLGKNYFILGEIIEARKYLESSLKLYKEINLNPDYVYENLAHIYCLNCDYEKCIKLCEEYIKDVHQNNIDIYYFLGKAKQGLRKNEESKKSYEKYIYLIDNYEITRQSESIYCEGATLGLKKDAYIEIIRLCYSLERYEEVISNYNKLNENGEETSKVNYFLINALYKTDNLEKVKEYYERCQTQSDKNMFIIDIENLILTIIEDDKRKIYEAAKEFHGNYGKLNEIRLGREKNMNVFKKVLKEEKHSYYGDIVYECIKNSRDITELLKDIDEVYIQEYINYIVNYKRDVVISLYDYLIARPTTLNPKNLKIYRTISKSLLFNGGMSKDKYKNVFYVYKTYTYFYLKKLYNPNLNDNELLDMIMDSDHRFVLKLNIIENIKKKDNLQYIKSLKELLLEYPNHKKGIQILIDSFHKEIGTGEKVQELKVQYKSIIENSINSGRIDNASKLIEEYEKIYDDEPDILNMKFVIGLLNDDLTEGESILKKSLFLDINNFNTMFNIGYLKEICGEFEESLMFYEKIRKECKEEEIVIEAQEKITTISNKVKLN